MALFTRRDRIAIACISALILAGWGVRLLLNTPQVRALAGTLLHQAPEDVRVIRGAVSPPALLNPADSLLHPARTVNDLAEKAGESLRVDINTADAALLETLPMIGPAKAAAIIQYREQHGRFFKSSDIMKVKGIGPGTYEKIEKRITTGNP